MTSDVLRYDRMVENALRGVVREALSASIAGLPGDHHFYITFRTRHPGVAISVALRGRYPDEMTIVLQHQYWDLEVREDWFEVTLSFNRISERLHIPFAAVTAFADPSAKFGLQFQVDTAEEEEFPEGEEAPAATEGDPAAPAPSEDEGAGGAQVITLDTFRKKTPS